jgi:hypothetical protein
VAHYPGGLLSFDYPASWHIIFVDVQEVYGSIGPVLGVGDWQEPCRTLEPSLSPQGGINCSQAWTVPAGGVVVEFSGSDGPAAVPTPPAGAMSLADGILATDLETASGSIWQLFLPARNGPNGMVIAASVITVEARYAEPNVEVSREQVRQLVESLRLVSP